MNQAQQSAKWNPRDSMNFREQGAFTEGQKPLRNIQQQTERSVHGGGDKEVAGSFCVHTEVGPALSGHYEEWVACPHGAGAGGC